MGAHSSWKGFISFGLLQFPAKLYTAARDKRVELHTYHTACTGPVKKPNHCPNCNVFLKEGEIFKGFEGPKGIIPLTAEEIKAITPASAKCMEISQCVPAASIGLKYYAESFYVLPDDGGNKAYSLLAQTLKATNSVAIAQLCKTNREHVALIRPEGNGLMIHFMWYADEIAQLAEFDNLQAADVSAAEMKLAKQLVESLTEPFDPEQFEDGYRGRMTTLIASKLDKTIEAPAPVAAAKTAATVDIADALAKSLANRPKRKDAALAKGGKKGKKVA